MSKKRPCDVLLVCGASGTGKTKVAYRLGEYYGMNVVQVDDFQCLVESVTKESDYPVFHYWKNHFQEAVLQPTEKKLEIMIEYANELSRFLEPIVLNHLEESRPMILEGDFISPDLCKKLLRDPETGSRIRCLLITEDSKDQIVRNYGSREGSIQEDRAELSQRYNVWLKHEAAASGIVIVPSRPWEPFERIVQALEGVGE